MIIYFDGGARPNPGMMATGIVADDGFEYFELRGPGTNNLAEWLACIEAAAYASNMAAEQLVLRGDSQLIVNQAAGRWKIKHAEFRPLYEKLWSILPGIETTFEYVPRARNLAGQLIERKYREGS